jgi:hypothetical protein
LRLDSFREEERKAITMDIELTQQEQLAASRLAGSWMGKLCFGGAKLFKGTGFVLDKSTKLAATGLRKTADGIETAGDISSSFCYDKADKLEKKAAEYEQDTDTLRNATYTAYHAENGEW